ncbi:MAG: L,D-transpeptidase [Bacillota bacterium]
MPYLILYRKAADHMDHLKKDLVEGRPHLFISKDDPEFYQKFLRCQPNHKEALYEHAKELYAQGKVVDAIKRLEKARSLGFHRADRLLKQWNGSVTAYRVSTDRKEGKNNRTALWILLVASIISLLLLLIPFLINNYWFEENNFYYSQDNHVVAAEKKTTKSELPTLLFLNAVKRFEERTGNYPNTESDLSNGSLKFLSHLPKEHYIFGKSPFEASANGVLYKRGVPDEFTLEISFYPDVNKLAIVRGNGEVLSTYPVASGKEPLPFSKSKVSERVVEPNGGKDALGTRGLVLQDGYAIHGTDNPFSIGGRITKGCIRLFNDHIEEIYPYVALGTSFTVKKGEPAPATFTEGLPAIPLSPQQLASETQPNKTFRWNH